MAMKQPLCFLLICFLLSVCLAQATDETVKNINNVKCDTMYIYAETTMKNLNEAYDGAYAILEIKVGDWLKNHHPQDSIEACVVKARKHFIQLKTRRGDYYRAFVYVRKSDIIPVADKSEVAVFEIEPMQKSDKTEAVPSITISEVVPQKQKETPALELTSVEQRIKQIQSFYDIEPYIKELKSRGELKNYGKYYNECC